MDPIEKLIALGEPTGHGPESLRAFAEQIMERPGKDRAEWLKRIVDLLQASGVSNDAEFCGETGRPLFIVMGSGDELPEVLLTRAQALSCSEEPIEGLIVLGGSARWGDPTSIRDDIRRVVSEERVRVAESIKRISEALESRTATSAFQIMPHNDHAPIDRRGMYGTKKSPHSYSEVKKRNNFFNHRGY